MAEGQNLVVLLGNLGADPELRVTQGGKAILRLRLATTESYLDKDNVRQEKTEWHSISIWGARGEGLAKILAKGDRLSVQGKLRTSEYEKDGVKQYRTEIVASHVFLCGGRRNNAGAGEAAPQARRSAAAPPQQRSGSAAPRQSTAGPSRNQAPQNDEDWAGDDGGPEDDDPIPF